MGRPIKKKYFGNTNYPYDNEQTGGDSGVGGEGVASVSVSNSGTLYSQGTTLAFSAPDVAGGTQAIPSYSINSLGNITVGVDTAGTGYTSAPTLTVTTASAVTQYTTNSGVTATFTISVYSVTGIAVGMRIYGGGNGGRVTNVNPSTNIVTSDEANSTTWTNAGNLAFYDQGSGFAKTVTLTGVKQNAISFASYIVGGEGVQTDGDILKQESSRRYLVQNSDGIGQCKLVASDTPAAGEMSIVATDGGGSTYWVKKLTAHKVTVVTRTSTSSAQVSIASDGIGVAGWTFGSPTAGSILQIANV